MTACWWIPRVLYFQACREVLGSVGIDLTLDQFKEISLRRGQSTFILATERGVSADDVERLRKERDRMYAELMAARSCVIDGAEEVLRALHGQVRMGVVTSARRQHFEAAHEKSRVDPVHGLRVDSGGLQALEAASRAVSNGHETPRASPDQCIVVEDSERGLAAATAAGIDCIIVLSEWTRDGDFTKAAAVVDNISGVVGELQRRISAG